MGPPRMAVTVTELGTAVSQAYIVPPEWTSLEQWQLDEIALTLLPISFLSFVDLEFPPDERARRFAAELAAALSAVGSRVRQQPIAREAAPEIGIELTLDAVPGPAQQTVAAALWNAGIRYRLHFQNPLAKPLIRIGLRPDCPLPR